MMYDTISNLDSEIYKLEYFLQDDVCRLCWSLAGEREIHHKSGENVEQMTNRILADTIRYCLCIDLSQKIIPNKLCQTCLENVENFCNFKNFCHETDKRLRKIFSSYDNKTQLDINAPALLKVENYDEKHTLLKTESIDDFLDSLRPSDHSSDDEKPLKSIKRQKNAESKTKLKNKDCYCNICKTDFQTTDTFSKHNSEAHGIENGYFKCFGCEKKCKTRRGRVGHETHFCKNLKDGYKCPKCAVFLPSRGCYEKHMKCHRESGTGTLPDVSVKCRKCPLTFKTRDGLVKHTKAEHNDVKKKFVCESCGRVFKRMDYLHKHKLTHTGTKQHVCAHCGFRTTQRTSLTVHIRKHTGERPYSCDLCPQRCVSSSNLKAHRRRHLGDKKYECTLCSKKFGYKVSLDEHFASTHDQSSSHACSYCGATYTRVRGLKRHVLTKHAGKGDKKTEENPKSNQENDVRITEAVANDLSEALKGEEVYVKLQNDTYVKVLQVKEAKSAISFELKEFDDKMTCVSREK